MNKKKIIIIVSAIFVTMIMLIILILFLYNKDKLGGELADGNKFKNEYEYYNNKIVRGTLMYPEVKIKSDNIVKYVDVDTILNFFEEDKSAVIYIGYSSCLYCRTAVQILLDTAEKTDLDTIYYLDVSKIWFEKELSNNNRVVETKKADEDYYKLINKLGNKFLNDYKLMSNEYVYIDTNEDRLEVPLVLFISNGNIVLYHIGTLPSQLDPLIRFDQSQIEGLRYIYSSGIDKVLKNINNN